MIKSIFGKDIVNGELYTDEMIQSYEAAFNADGAEGMLWLDESTGNTLVYYREKPHKQFVLGFIITADLKLYQIGVTKPYALVDASTFQEIHKGGVDAVDIALPTPEKPHDDEAPVDEPVVPEEPKEPEVTEPEVPVEPVEPTNPEEPVNPDVPEEELEVVTFDESDIFYDKEGRMWFTSKIDRENKKVYAFTEGSPAVYKWFKYVAPEAPSEPVEPEVPTKPYDEAILANPIELVGAKPEAGAWFLFEDFDWFAFEYVGDVLVGRSPDESVYKAFVFKAEETPVEPVEPTNPDTPEEPKEPEVTEPEVPKTVYNLNGTEIVLENITDTFVKENLTSILELLANRDKTIIPETNIEVYQIIQNGIEAGILEATNYFVVDSAMEAHKYNVVLPGDVVALIKVLEYDVRTFVSNYNSKKSSEDPVKEVPTITDHEVLIEDETVNL